MSTVIKVVDLSSDDDLYYVNLAPKKAVLCAYAQNLGDYAFERYEQRYGHLVKEGKHSYACGDFATRIA